MSALSTPALEVAVPPRLPELHPRTFALPPELEAPSPPENRGMTRDSVRMLVATKSDGSLVHSHFSELPRFLDEGDLVVINTSGTLAAELDAAELQAGGERLLALIQRSRPRILAIAGVTAYRTAFGHPRASTGPQPAPPDGPRVWVLPNPSGLQARYQLPEMTTLYRSSYTAAVGAG